ncbi:copper resistance CopC family protein [Arthrobacter sp. ISL-30]|uniref:copper resistance CopC family protein n=1 Tax=Arthrobacter sp. ISL-30 TaxID=2819109 RepID=UPI001BEC994F|nr:copper resistance CopC family protein [Arthrobacter sp. ISL-30]MBT2514882.1 copper resistance protein CopC [Arthrobacter sp. ISL-30]
MRQSRQPIIALIAAMATALAAALACAVALLAAVPASAHDAAASTAPANGSTVSSVPDKVSVTFSNNPLALGSQFIINDSSGTNWAEGPVEIVDNVASQKLKEGAPAGQFTVAWRVVSSDSHPIEGTFSFAAGSGATTSGAVTTPGTAGATGAPTAVATLGTAQPGAGTPAGPTAGTTGQTASDASEPFPWSIVVFALVALGLLTFLGVTARRRLAAGADEKGDDVVEE